MSQAALSRLPGRSPGLLNHMAPGDLTIRDALMLAVNPRRDALTV